MNADPKGATKIELSGWGDLTGALHMSTEKGFTSSNDNKIYIADGTASKYIANGSPETMYYFSFVPNSSDYTEGRANAETEKAPPPPTKRWKPGKAIVIDGEITSNVTPRNSDVNLGLPTRFVHPGEKITLEMASVSDTDEWTLGEGEGQTRGEDSDDLTYQWKEESLGGSGSIGNPRSSRIIWTVPVMTGDADSMKVTLKCTVDDTPKPLGQGESGNRGDGEQSKSLDFQVVRKKWVANPGIGQHPRRDANGQFDPHHITWENDGQIISPKPEDRAPQVFAGGSVSLEVGEAQDWDAWSLLGESDGVEQDAPLTYTWTAGKGHFVVTDDRGNTTQSNSAQGQSVLWIAPDDIQSDTDMEIKCTLDDPAGARVDAFDAGTRNDAPLERTVSVKVVKAKATASLKLLKANGDDAGDTIGGAVSVVLEIDLEGAKAGSKNAVVRIKETGTEGGVTHGDKEDHIDLPALDFTRADGWQQWLDADGDGPAEFAWQAATSAPVGTGKWRWSYGWNTAGVPTPLGDSKLLNHNGEHTISLVKVDGEESNTLEFGDVSAEVEEKGTTVGNLVIKPESISTSNGTSDYFKWDPDSEDVTTVNPTITFKIEDEGDKGTLENPHIYNWEIKIRSTSSESSEWEVITQGKMPLGSKTVKFNKPLSPDTQIGRALYRGTYTFEIVVQEVSQQEIVDTISYRSPYLSVAPGDDDLYNEWEGDALHAKVDYTISDEGGKNPTSLSVNFFDPEWKSVGSLPNPPKAINTLHENNDLHTYSDDETSGYFKVLFSGEDSHAAEYRDHKNKPMPAVNNYKKNLVVEWIDGYAYAGVSVKVIWIKKSLLGWAPRRKMQVAELRPRSFIPNQPIPGLPLPDLADSALPTVTEHLWSTLLNASGYSNGGTLGSIMDGNSASIPPSPTYSSTMRPKKGSIMGAINGTFYKTELPPYFPVSGDIGINGQWSGLDPARSFGAESKKWSFGINGSGLKVDRMVSSSTTGLWLSSPAIKGYNYGLGGLGCLIQDGNRVADNLIFPLKTGKVSNVVSGAYGRSIVAWTQDGKNAFLITGTGNMSNAPLVGTGWTGVQAQKFLQEFFPAMMANHTKSKNKPNGLGLSVYGAMLLDGGSHGQIAYAWNDKTRRREINPQIIDGGLQAMYEERHSIVDDSIGGLYSNGRGTRSAIEAFTLPQ